MKPSDVIDHLEDALERTADWRDRIEARYPEDGRNGKAADLLRRLQADAKHIDPATLEEYARLSLAYVDAWEQNEGFAHDATLSDIESEALRDVGFRSEPDDATDFVNGLIRELAVPMTLLAKLEGASS